jgi:IPT/TIG domain-containing protein
MSSKRLTSWSIPAVLAAFACALAGSAAAGPGSPPTITGFAPNHGLLGERVTIYGHDLAGAQVWFNGVQVAAQDVVIDPTGTHVQVRVPGEVATGPGPITVTTSAGTTQTKTMFTVNPPSRPTSIPAPRIGSFAPMRAAPGKKVTIHGNRLGGALWVKFGGVRATFTVPAANKIVAIVPAKARSGKITIRTGGGITTSRTAFAVSPASGI